MNLPSFSSSPSSTVVIFSPLSLSLYPHSSFVSRVGMPGKKAIAFAGGRRLEKLIVDFRKNALSDTDLLNGFGDVVSQIDQDAMNEQRVRDLLYELLTPFVR